MLPYEGDEAKKLTETAEKSGFDPARIALSSGQYLDTVKEKTDTVSNATTTQENTSATTAPAAETQAAPAAEATAPEAAATPEFEEQPRVGPAVPPTRHILSAAIGALYRTLNKGALKVFKSDPWGKALTPTKDPDAWDISADDYFAFELIPNFPKLPRELWARWVALAFDFCDPNNKSVDTTSEVSAVFLRNEVIVDGRPTIGDKWRILIPEQEVGGASVDAKFQTMQGVAKLVDIETGEEITSFPPPGWVHAGSTHSHNTMGAFFSGTDDANEINMPGMHIVIGRINRKDFKYEIACSIVLKKQRYPIPFDFVVDWTPVKGVDYHDNVLKIIKRKYSSYSSNYSSSSFPSGGSSSNWGGRSSSSTSSGSSTWSKDDKKDDKKNDKDETKDWNLLDIIASHKEKLTAEERAELEAYCASEGADPAILMGMVEKPTVDGKVAPLSKIKELAKLKDLPGGDKNETAQKLAQLKTLMEDLVCKPEAFDGLHDMMVFFGFSEEDPNPEREPALPNDEEEKEFNDVDLPEESGGNG